MNGRQAFRMTLERERKKKGNKGDIPEVPLRSGSRKRVHFEDRNHIDDNIAKAIDFKAVLDEHADLLRKLEKTKDVQGFIQDIAPSVAADLALLAKSAGSEKIKLEAIRDLLDRAGYGKVTKHAVARFDASTSKDTIISTILGAKKDLSKAGIEIVEDDDQNIEKGSGEANE